MFGVFSFWIFGMMTYLFPRIIGRSWYSRALCEWHFWLSAGGLSVMAIDLILLGPFQGYWWASLQPWDVSVDGSQPFWMTRVFAGLFMAAGLVVFLYNLVMTYRGAESTDRETAGAPVPA